MHPQVRCLLLPTALLLLLGCSAGTPTKVVPPPSEEESSGRKTNEVAVFTDVAKQAGIDFQRYDDIAGQRRLMESTGGGVGLIDYNNDGLLDVLLTNGCQLPLKQDDKTHPTRLYKNLGSMRFEDVTEEAGLAIFGYSQGCAVGDIDNDGFDDFYIAAYGENSLWRNTGDGRFENITSQAGVKAAQWSTSAAFADVNLDGYLDLYVVNYVQAKDDPPTLCKSTGSPDGYRQCPPTMFTASKDVLFLNQGDGTFADVTQAAGITGVDGKGLGVVIFDVDKDGRADIYVANDGTPNFLYMNATPRSKSPGRKTPSPVFEERALEMGAAVNAMGAAQASMGIACGDFNRDGWSDLYLTHFFAETNTLYRNERGEAFVDTTISSRLGPPTRQMLGFGAMFLDVENDGWLDLFVANGHIDDVSWAETGEPYRMPPQLFSNQRNGAFEDVSRRSGDYFGGQWLGRGVASGDLDNDGDIDLVVSHQLGPAAILRNDTAADSPSVTLSLVGGKGSNRSAIGAIAEAALPGGKIMREVFGGGSFQSSSDRRLHFGLGENAAIEKLTVRWPSGETSEWRDIKPGFYTAVEGQELEPAPSQD